MLRVLILLVALSAAGIAAWLTMSGQSSTEAPSVIARSPQVANEEVLVVSADLSQGQKLDETNARWQAWPADGMNPGFVTRAARPEALQELAGSVVRSRMLAGEPVRQEKLASAGSNFLSAALPTGMRAVAIRVSAESTAGGFVLPDDRVDVIHTVAQPGKTEGVVENESETILTNIRVLAIDQRADETGGESVALGKTATLELSPGQAEVISGAQASGLLSLALRSAADRDEAQTVAVEEEERVSRVVRVVAGGRTTLVETPEFGRGEGRLLADTGASAPPRLGATAETTDGPRS